MAPVSGRSPNAHQGVLIAMTISKLMPAAARALALILIVGAPSAFGFQQEAAKEPPETEAAQDAPGDDSELSELVKSFVEESARKRAELKELSRSRDEAVFSALEGLLQLAAPLAPKDPPEDGSDHLADAKAQLENIKRAEGEMAKRGRKYNEKLESIVKDAQELAEQIEKLSGKSKRGAEAKDEKRPRWLPTDRPAVVPSEDGRVVTIFPFPWWSEGVGGEMGDEIKKDQMKASAPKSVRLAEADSPRLEVQPRFYRLPSNRLVIALALSGEKIQRLAVFDPEIMDWRHGGFGGGIRGQWVVQDLLEPAAEATPVVGARILVYVLGHRIYTYRFSSGKWDVLELPEGARPEPPAEGFGGLALEHDGIIYSYNPPTGEWAKIDTRVVPDASFDNEEPEENQPADANDFR